MDSGVFTYYHAVGGSHPGSMYNGIYAVYDSDTGMSLSLDEDDAGGGPYTGTLGAPTAGSPWEFTVTMYPSLPSGGDAYFSVTGADMYGTQPFSYTSASSHTGDYSDALLVAQIYSGTEDALFSFEDVRVEVIPEPTTVLMVGGLAAGLAGARQFRKKK
jgi:hypothetical protein